MHVLVHSSLRSSPLLLRRSFPALLSNTDLEEQTSTYRTRQFLLKIALHAATSLTFCHCSVTIAAILIKGAVGEFSY